MGNTESPPLDVVVVGAGFAGLYLLHRLRGAGFSARCVEAADDVGGTWYWNRYPGARCDIESLDYQYTFDPELDETWQWSEKYAPQPEILRYLQHVADTHDLRRDISFGVRVDAAQWDDVRARWHIRISDGAVLTCRHYVMATGCLSVPKEVDIDGAERFRGRTYWTSRWPHEGVDLTGQRVAVIGTGSSAIQSIPIIAAQAAHLTVFQRTPNFSVPAHNGQVSPERLDDFARDRAAYRAAARVSTGGVPITPVQTSALAVSDDERRARYDDAWARGGLIEFLGSYADHLSSPAANELLAEFVREKIRSIVDDPETAATLCPTTYPIGTKRLCVDTGYYETYNRPHVRLVDLGRHPIATITESGIDLVDETMAFDAIVFATGFDAMTGAVVAVDIEGHDGRTLESAWAHGPATYLGLMVEGFPNLFMITGPGSPSVLTNMVPSIEQHVEWIVDCLDHMRTNALERIEPTTTAVERWVQHVNDYADLTLMTTANSWYVGANVPGKPRVFMPYVGGLGPYRTICDEVATRDYLGFAFRGAGGTRCIDGVIRRAKPDVQLMLDAIAGLALAPLESLSPEEARALMAGAETMRAPGPAVGEIVDDALPGPAGPLAYRLYRPDTAGPHPIVVYFHGGGWVLGSSTADDPLCRDLCVRSDAIVVSVDYRHAPEAPFPAAVDDVFASVCWVAEHATEFGGVPGELAVAGWSAGGNLAAVVCLLARDAGGPAIAGQLLLTPVTDSDLTRPSYADESGGAMPSRSMMSWFWHLYIPDGDRADPRAAPLRAKSLTGLAPAFVVTAELDPLRDEGIAYADALIAAGVPTRHLVAAGHTHASVTAVDMLPSGAPVRAEMAAALRRFFGRLPTAEVAR